MATERPGDDTNNGHMGQVKKMGYLKRNLMFTEFIIWIGCVDQKMEIVLKHIAHSA